MWRAHGLAKSSQEFVLAPYETLLQLTDTSIPLFMAARWRGEPGSKGIRRAAFPKPQTEEFGDGWRLLQRAGYETEVTGCDQKKRKESLLLHPVGIGHVCSRDDDSAPARQRSRVSWRVKGALDRSERMQIRDRNEMSHIRNVSISIRLCCMLPETHRNTGGRMTWT